MSKDSSVKYYQKKTKKGFKKKLGKGIKIFLKKERRKNKNMVINDIKIFLMMTSKYYNIITILLLNYYYNIIKNGKTKPLPKQKVKNVFPKHIKQYFKDFCFQ